VSDEAEMTRATRFDLPRIVVYVFGDSPHDLR
jgi:hypothetical protein